MTKAKTIDEQAREICHDMMPDTGYRGGSPIVAEFAREIIKKCAGISEALDSGRGNEKEITRAILALGEK